MSTSPTQHDPAKAPGLPHEADIGSGEKTPGQAETEKIIAQIPPLPASGAEPQTDAKKPG